MLKILITGSTGFIGKNIISKLSKEYEVICIIRNRPKFLKQKNFRYIICDLLDKEDMIKKLRNYSFDIVIHLASKIDNEENILLTNKSLTKNLLDCVASSGIKQFIFTSSCAVYDKIPFGKKIDVNYKLHPASDYGKSKLGSESLIKEYAHRFNFSYTILRLHMVYGTGDKNICPLISLIKRYKIIPLINNGNYLVQPVYVNDVVKAVIKSINNRNVFNKTYNLAGPSSLLFKELVLLISKEMNKDRIFINVPLPFALAEASFISAIGKLLNKKIRFNQAIIKRAIMNSSYDISKIKKDLNIRFISIFLGIKKLKQYENNTNKSTIWS